MSTPKTTPRKRVRKVGRPKKPRALRAGRRIAVRLYVDDEAALKHCCDALNVKEGEAVRRALRDLASRIWT